MKKAIFLISIVLMSLFMFGCSKKAEVQPIITPPAEEPITAQPTAEPTTPAAQPIVEPEKPKGITFTKIETQQISGSGNNPLVKDDYILWDKTAYSIDTKETKAANVVFPYMLDSNKVYFLGQGGIHSLDLGATNTDTLVTPTATIASIDADNGNIVWSEGVKVYFYTAATQEKSLLSDFGSNPRINGDNIVWLDGKDGYTFSNADLYVYSISAGTKKKIINLKIKSADKGLDIYGDNVVYTNYNSDTASNDIYMVNINTEKITHIEVDKGEQIRPGIYENIIVWEDYNVQEEDKIATSYDIPTHVMAYNINDGKITQITSGAGAKLKPQIDKNHVVWYGRSGIYLATLS